MYSIVSGCAVHYNDGAFEMTGGAAKCTAEEKVYILAKSIDHGNQSVLDIKWPATQYTADQLMIWSNCFYKLIGCAKHDYKGAFKMNFGAAKSAAKQEVYTIAKTFAM